MKTNVIKKAYSNVKKLKISPKDIEWKFPTFFCDKEKITAGLSFKQIKVFKEDIVKIANLSFGLFVFLKSGKIYKKTNNGFRFFCFAQYSKIDKVFEIVYKGANCLAFFSNGCVYVLGKNSLILKISAKEIIFLDGKLYYHKDNKLFISNGFNYTQNTCDFSLSNNLEFEEEIVELIASNSNIYVILSHAIYLLGIKNEEYYLEKIIDGLPLTKGGGVVFQNDLYLICEKYLYCINNKSLKNIYQLDKGYFSLYGQRLNDSILFLISNNQEKKLMCYMPNNDSNCFLEGVDGFSNEYFFYKNSLKVLDFNKTSNSSLLGTYYFPFENKKTVCNLQFVSNIKGKIVISDKQKRLEFEVCPGKNNLVFNMLTEKIDIEVLGLEDKLEIKDICIYYRD